MLKSTNHLRYSCKERAAHAKERHAVDCSGCHQYHLSNVPVCVCMRDYVLVVVHDSERTTASATQLQPFIFSETTPLELTTRQWAEPRGCVSGIAIASAAQPLHM